MKGKVLGANMQGGTITAEDGRRYKFETAQWRGERLPSAGDEVDFEAGDDGRALDVYPLRASLNVDFSAVSGQAKAILGGGVNSPIGAHLLALATGNPIFQISVVILLASFFLTFVKLGTILAPDVSGSLPHRGLFSLINIHDLIDYLKSALTAAAAGADQVSNLMGRLSQNPYGPADQSPALSDHANDMGDKMRAMAGMSNILYVLYLAPLLAAGSIVQLIRRQSAQLIALATGAAGIVSFVMLIVWRSSIINAVKSAGDSGLGSLTGDIASVAGRLVSFGLGSYVILLCSIALLGAALGLIRLPRKA